MDLGKLRGCILTIVIIAFFIGVILIVSDILLTNNFCESKGYDWWHTNTEEGYIACCNTLTENHIKTDENICEAFKYRRLCGNLC